MRSLGVKVTVFLALILHVFAVTEQPDGSAIVDTKRVADPVLVGAGYDATGRQTARIFKRGKVPKRGKRAKTIGGLRLIGLGMEGMLAVNKLLKDAAQVATKEKNVRVFEKAGDFETAMADFNSLKPWLVTKKSYPGGNRLVTGQVGNRFIVVDKIGQKQKPTITVLRETDGVYDSSDRIIYSKDKM